MKSLVILALFSLAIPAWAQMAVVAAPQQPSVTAAAYQAQQSLDRGASMNMMVGGMLLGVGMSSKPPNMLVCLIGGMMLAQGLQMKSQANQAADTMAVASAQGSTMLVRMPASVPGVMPPGMVMRTASINNGLQTLSGAGYKISSAGGVTLPNGHVLGASSINSPQGLAAMGFTQKDVQAAQQMTDRANQDATKLLDGGQDI